MTPDDHAETVFERCTHHLSCRVACKACVSDAIREAQEGARVEAREACAQVVAQFQCPWGQAGRECYCFQCLRVAQVRAREEFKVACGDPRYLLILPASPEPARCLGESGDCGHMDHPESTPQRPEPIRITADSMTKIIERLENPAPTKELTALMADPEHAFVPCPPDCYEFIRTGQREDWCHCQEPSGLMCLRRAAEHPERQEPERCKERDIEDRFRYCNQPMWGGVCPDHPSSSTPSEGK
jgi:hypothetical protein